MDWKETKDGLGDLGGAEPKHRVKKVVTNPKLRLDKTGLVYFGFNWVLKVLMSVLFVLVI